MRKLIMLLIMITLYGCKSSVPVEIEFYNRPCIIPHKQYSYKTCHAIFVAVDKEVVTIPDGFETDLASIPRWYWAVSNPSNSDFMGASILHDYLYRCTSSYTRTEADSIFYYALRGKDVSVYTSYKMYLAVRLFGGRNFDPKGECREPDPR